MEFKVLFHNQIMKQAKQGFGIVILVLGLIAGLVYVKYPQLWWSLAGKEKKVDVFVYLTAKSRPLGWFWKSLAQGGEENRPMLGEVQTQLLEYQPEYIRLDHVFDYYDTVRVNKAGEIEFNWVKLDIAINQILAAKAKPALALSYFPPWMTKEGRVDGMINDWRLWRLMVKELIQHVSGELGIEGVIYEVWNEPNLFGKFSMTTGKKGYLSLYEQTIAALPQSNQVKHFLIGGPALSFADYKNIEKFLEYVKEKNLRLDFVSFHAYHKDPDKFVKEIQKVKVISQKIKGETPVFITEWGLSGEKDKGYRNTFGYWHAMAVITATAKVMGPKDKMFVFEVKDGPGEDGVGWGLFSYKAKPRPRWWGLKQLNQIPWEEKINFQPPDNLWGVVVKDKKAQHLGVVLVNKKNQLIQPVIRWRFMNNGLWEVIINQGLVNQIKEKKVVNLGWLDYKIDLLPKKAVVISLKQVDDFVRVRSKDGGYGLKLVKNYSFKVGRFDTGLGWGCGFVIKSNNLEANDQAVMLVKVKQRVIAGLKYGFYNLKPGFYLESGKRRSDTVIYYKEKDKAWLPVKCWMERGGINDVFYVEIKDQILSLPVMSSGAAEVSLELVKNPDLIVDDVKIYDLGGSKEQVYDFEVR